MIIMDILELMKYRRSIRRYTDKQVSEEDLLKILEAGAYAPNAGGGQRSRFVACQDRTLNEAIGKLNIARFDRSHLAGNFVSKEQPSIIDDPSIRSGFYGAPTVITIFGPKRFLYSVPDAFCAAKTWCSKPPLSDSRRVFWHEAKRRSTTLKEKKSCNRGIFPTRW